VQNSAGSLPSSPASLTSLPNDGDMNTRQNLEAILKMGSKDSGVIREARMIDGVRYTQGFSGKTIKFQVAF